MLRSYQLDEIALLSSLHHPKSISLVSHETIGYRPRIASKYALLSFCNTAHSFSNLSWEYQSTRRQIPLDIPTYNRYLDSSSANSRSTVRSTWPVFCMSYHMHRLECCIKGSEMSIQRSPPYSQISWICYIIVSVYPYLRISWPRMTLTTTCWLGVIRVYSPTISFQLSWWSRGESSPPQWRIALLVTSHAIKFTAPCNYLVSVSESYCVYFDYG